MSFLQPLILAALPLMALPVIIHLLHRRRHRTVEWGAMMFLMAARKINRGWQRLRHFLILLFRTLAVATLIFAISRPLSGGWLGFAIGARPDTAIVLLDRSASMQEQDLQRAQSKLAIGTEKLVNTLETVRASRWALIESTANTVTELDSPRDLLEMPSARETETQGDIPGMLQAALEYIEENQTGRVEIWLCSDSRGNDWQSSSGRWKALREALMALPQGVSIHLLSYSESSPENLGVRVTQVRRRVIQGRAELVFDIELRRATPTSTTIEVPVTFSVNGARSTVKVELNGIEARLEGHVIPIEANLERGWGVIEIANDHQPADNRFYFVFGKDPPRRTVVVAEDPWVSDIVSFAASARLDPIVTYEVEKWAPTEVLAMGWDQLSLVVWQAPLPEGDIATDLRNFIESGGQVMFLPPTNPTATEFLGMRWGGWHRSDTDGAFAVATWREESDLLRHTASGKALPVGDINVFEYCEIEGKGTVLARLEQRVPFFVRATTTAGGAYFLSTLPRALSSNLDRQGVVLFAVVHRAIAEGARALRPGLQWEASSALEIGEQWKRVEQLAPVLSNEEGLHAGAFESEARLAAVNRPLLEDTARVLPREAVDELFDGLEYVRIEDQVTSDDDLVKEVWRLFLVSMLVALLLEALLCLPDVKNKAREAEPAI